MADNLKDTKKLPSLHSKGGNSTARRRSEKLTVLELQHRIRQEEEEWQEYEYCTNQSENS